MASGSNHLITAYYSFIDPERMKGWVDLVSWPTADGLPDTDSIETDKQMIKMTQTRKPQNLFPSIPLFFTTVPSVPSPVCEGHVGMVLNRKYEEGEWRWNWLTHVHLEGWPLDHRVSVNMVSAHPVWDCKPCFLLLFGCHRDFTSTVGNWWRCNSFQWLGRWRLWGRLQ